MFFAPSYSVHSILGAFAWLGLPLLLAIHSGWLVCTPDANLCAARNMGERIAELLPDHSALMVVEPETTDTLFPYIINFELALDGLKSGHQSAVIRQINANEIRSSPTQIREIEKDTAINTIFLRKAEHETYDIEGFNNRSSPVLLVRSGETWRQTKIPE